MDRVRVWGDQFELDLPSGWKLGDATETIEAYSELGDGAVHFSVINPVGRSWVPEEVAREVAERALSDPAVSSTSRTSMSRRAHRSRAFAADTFPVPSYVIITGGGSRAKSTH